MLEPAIRAAVDGFAVSELVAHYWWGLHRAGVLDASARRRARAGRPHAARGRVVPRCRRSARTLRAIADHGAKAFYAGPVADAIVAASRAADGFLAHDDLASHASTWVDPIATTYRGVGVAELPPNGQGLAALVALNVLEALEPADPASALHWHRRIEAVKLAFADRDEYVADPEQAEIPVAALLDKAYARRRAALVGERALEAPAPGRPGDTVYLCAADGEGNLVSFIQSLFIRLRLGRRLRRHGRRAPEPRRRLPSRSPAPECVGARQAAVPHHHPRHAAPRRRALDRVRLDGRADPAAEPPELRRERRRRRPERRRRRSTARASASRAGKKVLLEAPDGASRRAARSRAPSPRAGTRSSGRPAIAFDAFGGGQAIAALPDGVLAGASDRRKDGCALGLY